MMHRTLFVSLVLLVSALGSAACAQGGTPQPSSGTQDLAPQYGGVFRMRAGGQEFPNFDPRTLGVSGQSFHVAANVFSGLIRHPFGPNALSEPPVCELCERWELVDGGKGLVFHLRQGVKWHNKPPANGRELTAEDVRWGLTDGEGYNSKDPRFSAEWRNLTNVLGITSVEALDKYTVKINLRAPLASFLVELSNPVMTFVPREAVEAARTAENPQGFVGLPITDSRNVAGSGPFLFKEYQPGVGGTLVRNPDYFLTDQLLKNGNKLPYLDELQFLTIFDHQTRTAAMLAGQLDESGVYLDDGDYDRLVPTGQFEWAAGLTGNGVWMMFNTEKPPFNDVRVRKAMHLIVNRQDLLKVENMKDTQVARWIPSAWQPYGFPLEEVLKLPGYRPDKSQDLAEARRLLAEAGLGSDFSFNLLVQKGGLGYEEVTVLQSQFKNVGIKMEIDLQDRATYTARQLSGAYDVAHGAQLCAGPDPGDCFTRWLTLEQARTYHLLPMPDLDVLLKQQATILDQAERVKVIRHILEQLDERLPGASFFRNPWYRSWRKGFHNVAPEPRAGGQTHWVDHVWKEQ